jgi:hypothetical protein
MENVLWDASDRKAGTLILPIPPVLSAPPRRLTETSLSVFGRAHPLTALCGASRDIQGIAEHSEITQLSKRPAPACKSSLSARGAPRHSERRRASPGKRGLLLAVGRSKKDRTATSARKPIISSSSNQAQYPSVLTKSRCSVSVTRQSCPRMHGPFLQHTTASHSKRRSR